MFGITGSRWLGRADMKRLVNEFWVRQAASETPVNAIQFERAICSRALSYGFI